METLSAKDQDQFFQTLDCLKRLQIFDSVQQRLGLPLQKSQVFNVPNLALQTSNLDQFIDVANEWFRQSKLICDGLRSDQFNAANVLACLGQINRRTNGRLFEKFDHDWRPIEYFIRRMSDDCGDADATPGFKRYTIEEIVSALAGIRDFAVHAQTSISNKQIFNSWLREFGDYITKMERGDPGYCFLERRSSYILFLLAGVTSIGKLPSDLLWSLCRYSKFSFDQRLNEKSENQHDDGKRVNPILNDEISCFYYSHAFLYWLSDPNSIIRDSWKSWFGICRLIFELRVKQFRVHGDDSPATASTLRFLSRVVSVAVEFEASEEFWSIFNLWKRVLMEVLYRYSAPSYVQNRSEEEIDAARVYLADFVYNLSLLLKKLPQSYDCRNCFEHLLPMIDGALANLGINDGLSHNRALTGFRNLKSSMRSEDFELSVQYYRMIQEWCKRTRENAKRDSSGLADTAATIMFLLRDMKLRQNGDARLRTLEELTLLFQEGFDSLEEKDTNRALSYFGDACLNFHIDPRLMCSRRGKDDVWCKYFEKAKSYLENCSPSTTINYGETRKLAHLLSILADVAYRYKRLDEFSCLYGIYERRLRSVLNSLSVSQSHYLYRTLTKMRAQGLPVGEQVLVVLRDKAVSFVPKSQRHGALTS